MTPRCRWVWRAAAVAACAAHLRAQTVDFTLVGTIPGPADLVTVQGTRAYVAAGKTLTVVDISNPATPARSGTYTFPELIWGLAAAGSTLYVAADTYGVGILDVSNAAAPVLRGAFKTRGQVKNVAPFNGKALVADHVGGIGVIDLSTANPTLADSFFVDGFAKDVVTRGALAYAIDQPSGLYVFDLAKSGSFEPVTTLALASPIPLRAQLAVSEASTTKPTARVAVVVGGGPLQVYDISNALKPAFAASYRTPGAAQRVSLQGTRAYVADGPAGLQVVDLSIPSKPNAVGSYKTPTPARDVAVADSLVLVAVASGDVLILRQSN